MRHGPGFTPIRVACRTGVAAALVVLLQPHALAAGPSRCAAEQRTIFSCSTTARKIISICASPDLAASAGALQYRFGRARAADLAYPAIDADWRTVTRAGVLMFSGGGGAYLAFANPPYRYIVYSAIGQGWGSKAGVVVEKSGKRVSSLRCKGGETSELGPDLFASAGIAEDSSSFELP